MVMSVDQTQSYQRGESRWFLQRERSENVHSHQHACDEGERYQIAFEASRHDSVKYSSPVVNNASYLRVSFDAISKGQ